MVFDPGRETDAITPDESIRWCVTDQFLFETAHPSDVGGSYGSVESAISEAQTLSAKQCTSLYVWAYPHAEEKREAIAVAIGGELYFRREAQPAVISPTERLKLAGMIMAGMISGQMLQEWELDELVTQSLEHADSLIAASQGARD